MDIIYFNEEKNRGQALIMHFVEPFYFYNLHHISKLLNAV